MQELTPINPKILKALAKQTVGRKDWRERLKCVHVRKRGFTVIAEATDSNRLARFTYEHNNETEFDALFSVDSIKALKATDTVYVALDDDGNASLTTATGFKFPAVDLEAATGYPKTDQFFEPESGKKDGDAIFAVNPAYMAEACAAVSTLNAKGATNPTVLIRGCAVGAVLLYAESENVRYDAVVMPVRDKDLKPRNPWAY